MAKDKKILEINSKTDKSYVSAPTPPKPLLGEKDVLNGHEHDSGASRVPSNVSTHYPVMKGAQTPDSASAEANPMHDSERNSTKPTAKSGKKKKAEIETLEQFILHAYSSKGRKVMLSGAIEKRIGPKPTLDADAVERIMSKSRGDLLFAVPRQLLLVARDIQTYPALRSAIREYVKITMLAHPLFAKQHIAAAINNLPEAPSMIEAVRAVARSELPLELRSTGKRVTKSTQLADIRANAVYCLAVWFHDNRGASISELCDALYRGLWSQAATSLRDEQTKLRALTELRDLAAVGLVSGEFQTASTSRIRQMEAAQQEASQAKSEVAALRDKIDQLRETYNLRVAQLESQVQDLDALAEKSRTESQHQLIHLRDDLEQQRTRILRRLKADVGLLEEGLTALRRETPKIHVMDDHAERVADALRQEIKKLESGG